MSFTNNIFNKICLKSNLILKKKLITARKKRDVAFNEEAPNQYQQGLPIEYIHRIRQEHFLVRRIFW